MPIAFIACNTLGFFGQTANLPGVGALPDALRYLQCYRPNEENGQEIHKNIRIIEPGKFDPVTPMLIYQITYTVIFE